VARVVAVFDDLLLGSNVLGALQAAGHEASLAAPSVEGVDADVLVVDLGSAGFDGVEVAERLRGAGSAARVLGVYSHVHHELKLRAEEAGFDLVVPRSRMAREGPTLVERLAER
jgi:DNA-binding NarL/FixJ family response regulator